jgi:hypothetical protein
MDDDLEFLAVVRGVELWSHRRRAPNAEIRANLPRFWLIVESINNDVDLEKLESSFNSIPKPSTREAASKS